MGRNKYSQSEIEQIGKLLRLKCKSNRLKQKQIRHELRTEYEFNISDFGEQGKAFGYDELQEALRRGAIQILDDATIADMKAKRERDRQKDAGEAEWQKAMKEWNEYYNDNDNVNSNDNSNVNS